MNTVGIGIVRKQANWIHLGVCLIVVANKIEVTGIASREKEKYPCDPPADCAWSSQPEAARLRAPNMTSHARSIVSQSSGS